LKLSEMTCKWKTWISKPKHVIIYYDADVFNGGRQLLRLQALRPLGPAQDNSYVAEQLILEQSSSSALAGCPVFRVKALSEEVTSVKVEPS
jgi:hypothetical protein